MTSPDTTGKTDTPARAAEIVREYGPFNGADRVHGVTHDGHRVWAATGAQIVAFDPDSGQVVRTLDVAAHAGTAFDGKHLRVKATYYSRQAPLSEFRLDQARVVDTREHTEFKPLLKTNGFALPGLSAGHFRLRNLGKAFCLLTDRTRVLTLPLRDGGLVLLSPARPADLLARLRELATPSPHR